jgi:hypothetical protein
VKVKAGFVIASAYSANFYELAEPGLDRSPRVQPALIGGLLAQYAQVSRKQVSDFFRWSDLR